MPDSTAIDQAIVDKLNTDATLVALMPGGIWWDEAPAASTKFVVVSLVEEHDEAVFGGRAIEDGLYLVKAVELKPSTGAGDIKAAAARIDVLLENATLAVSGFTHMACFREERVRFTEVDEADESIRWQHRGGRYRVQCSL